MKHPVKPGNAMELAFKNLVVDGINKDKEAIKAALFGKKRVIQPAPKAGKIPVEKIQAAVESVSKKHDATKSKETVSNVGAGKLDHADDME